MTSDANDKGPIFIGGAGRSGTSLLRTMLDAHANICCGPELKVLPQIAQLRGDLTGPLAGVMRSYDNSSQDVDRHIRDLIVGLVSNFRQASGKPRWAEKTPHNVRHMLVLSPIFPEAKFLHVIRDGRDVACSLVTMNWQNQQTGKKVEYIQSIAKAAGYWRAIVSDARKQAAHPSLVSRVLEVRYESLVTHTESTLRDVLEFLDEPWDANVLEHESGPQASRDELIESSTEQVQEPVYESSIGRWKTDMTPQDQEEFRRAAGDLLKQCGYD